MLALVLALSGPPAPPAVTPPAWYGGRLLSTPSLHVGLRPALFVGAGEVDVGLTLQISTRAL